MIGRCTLLDSNNNNNMSVGDVFKMDRKKKIENVSRVRAECWEKTFDV